MKNKTGWMLMGVWFVTLIAAFNFLRFRFGLLNIAGVWLALGILIAVFSSRKSN
jgi:hypothetical protein